MFIEVINGFIYKCQVCGTTISLFSCDCDCLFNDVLSTSILYSVYDKVISNNILLKTIYNESLVLYIKCVFQCFP